MELIGKKDINKFINSLIDLLPCSLPIGLSLFRKGLMLMKNWKMYYEDKIGDLDKNGVFVYLVENRIFIDSLSDEEIKRTYKYFKTCYKNRVIWNIENFFLDIYSNVKRKCFKK